MVGLSSSQCAEITRMDLGAVFSSVATVFKYCVKCACPSCPITGIGPPPWLTNKAGNRAVAVAAAASDIVQVASMHRECWSARVELTSVNKQRNLNNGSTSREVKRMATKGESLAS